MDLTLSGLWLCFAIRIKGLLYENGIFLKGILKYIKARERNNPYMDYLKCKIRDEFREQILDVCSAMEHLSKLVCY